MDTIDFKDFQNIQIAIGTIEAVEIVEDADKLLCLTVNVGEETPRQIISGIRAYFDDPHSLVGRQAPFVLNLPTRKLRGLESQGMILAASTDTAFALLQPSSEVPPGTIVS